jgi:hypothetical protein
VGVPNITIVRGGQPQGSQETVNIQIDGNIWITYFSVYKLRPSVTCLTDTTIIDSQFMNKMSVILLWHFSDFISS